jgi:hypothetical protein
MLLNKHWYQATTKLFTEWSFLIGLGDINFRFKWGKMVQEQNKIEYLTLKNYLFEFPAHSLNSVSHISKLLQQNSIPFKGKDFFSIPPKKENFNWQF